MSIKTKVGNGIKSVGTWFSGGDESFLSVWTKLTDQVYSNNNIINDEGSTLLNAYLRTPYACIQRRADAIALQPLRLFTTQKTGNNRKAVDIKRKKYLFSNRSGLANLKVLKQANQKDVEEIIEHPALTLLEEGNDYQDGFMISKGTETYQLLIGDAYWYLQGVKDLDKPVAIHLLLPQNIKIIENPEQYRMIDGYEYNIGGKPILYDKKEIIHFQYFNPKDWKKGFSPTLAVKDIINLDATLIESLKSIAGNKFAMDVYLHFAGKAHGLTREQIDDLKAQFARFRTGQIAMDQVPVLQGEWTLEQIPFANADLPYSDNIKLFRELICNVFGVPVSMITTESSNRATSQTSKIEFAEYTILPQLIQRQQILNAQYLKLFKNTEGMFFAYDDPVPENEEFELKEHVQLVGAGIMTPNEARQDRGLESEEMGDVLYMSSTMVEMGQQPEMQARAFVDEIDKAIKGKYENKLIID